MKLCVFLCLLVVGLVLSEEDATKDIKAVRGVFEVCSIVDDLGRVLTV